MARIAVGGFQHETNTCAPLKATYRDVEQAAGWPGGPPPDVQPQRLAGWQRATIA